VALRRKSKSTPIDVRPPPKKKVLAALIVLHASRLVGLTLRFDDSHSLSQIVKHLDYPIPTLHTLRIITDGPWLYTLEFPSVLQNPFFLHSKKLEIKGVGLCTDQIPRLVTLPHVQEMSLSASSRVGMSVRTPHILDFIRLPNLRSISLRAMPRLVTYPRIFPVIPLSKHLPKLTELPELGVELWMSSCEATFQSPSQATLKHVTRPFSSYDQHGHLLWEDLPPHSVRRLTVNVVSPSSDQELEWLMGLLWDLKSLEDLEFGGECIRKNLCS